MATFNGTDGDDVFPNPEHPDNSGDDEIDGNGGNDILHGGAGNDDIDGGTGEDFIDGGEGDDIIEGDDDDDTLYGGAGNDEVDGDQGDDLIYGGAGDDVLDGDDGNDEVYGGDGDDDVEGDGGDDIVDGGAGNDIVRGNDGDDLAIFTLSENTIGPDQYYENYYKGGVGFDTLRIRVTQDEYDRFQDELEELRLFIEENADPTEHGGPRFTTSFNLKVRDFEALEIVILNPPPILDLDANDSTAPGFDVAASFVEEGGPVRVTSENPDVVITDPDSTELTEAIVTLTNRPNGGAESLALSSYGQTLLGNLMLTAYDPDTGILKIEGTASLQQYASLLQEIVYDNTSENPDTTPRRVSFVVKDEYSNSNEAFSTLSVTGENDAPVLDDVDSPVVFDENDVNASPQILDASVTLDDVDSPDFDGGFLLVTYSTGGGPEDQLSVGSLIVDGETIGSLDPAADGSNGNALRILLNEEATRQRVEQLIERLAYQNASDTPTASRTIQIEVNDGDGGTSLPREIEIQVLSENDAPVLTEVSPLVTFSEDLVNAAAQVLDADVTLTDKDSLDFDQGHLRVYYTQGGGMEDQLSIPSLEVQGFVIGTLHPSDDGMGGNALQIDLNEHATPLRVEALIERLSYQNTSNNPAESRTIAIEVSDGDGGISTPREIEIRVEGDNEAPVLTDVLPVVTFEATTVTVVPQILDSDVSLEDVDSPNFDGGELLVTYFLGGENTDQLAIPDLEVEGHTIGTLHGTDDGQNGATLRILLNDEATPIRVEMLIERLTYRSTAAEPAESRTIEITVEDDEGGISDPRQLEIRIEPPNEPPVLEDVGVETPFNEDMLQAEPQLIDSNVTLTDLDSPDFDTGWVLVQFLDGTTDDRLGIRDEGAGPGEIGFDGTDVTFEGTVIGTLDSTATGANGTDLRIFLNANATPANTEALIENITFQNTSDDPNPTRTVRFLVNDGDGGTSDPDDVLIQILGVNDAPVLTDVDSPAVFDEQMVNATPQILDADVTLTDPDSPDFAGGILLVTYTAGGGSEDQLILDSLVVDGFTIGTLDVVDNGQDGSALRVVFNSDATRDRVEQLIERLAYQNTSDAPNASRTISIVVNDGDGGTSLPREIEIQITPVNDRPEILNLAPVVTFAENTVNGAPQPVDADVQLRDDDSPDFDGGYLLIRGSGLAEDDLALSSSLIAQVGGTLDPTLNGMGGADLRVEFDMGGAARDLVEQLIESLTYRNTSDTPTDSRTIHVSVDDGDGGTSIERSVEIRVNPENDRPVLDNVRPSLGVVENDPATVVDGDVSLSDSDSVDFDGGFLRISYSSGGGAEDQLVIGDLEVGGVAVGTVDPIENGVDGAALKILLNVNATPERVEQLIERLTYQNTSEDPAASRTISIVVDDNDGGTSPSIPREVVIDVTPVNDAPTLAGVIGAVGFNENDVNAAPQVIDADVAISDLDSADFDGGYVLVTYAAGGGPEDQLSVPSLMVDGITIASIDASEDGVNGAALRLLLNADATQVRVELLLETLSYQNTSNAPTFSRTIEITINDGDGTPNGGDDTSAPQQVVIEVNPQNDAPVLQEVEPLVSFDEQLVNAGAHVIDSDVSLEDDDSPDFDGGTLLITYTDGGGTEDHLELPSLLIEGFMVGTLDAVENGVAGANLLVHLNQNATPARIEQLVETLSYRNSSNDPSLSRTIEITVNDGDGTLNGGNDTSEPRQIVIEVDSQNDAPVLEDVFTDRAFVEDAAPETLDFDVTLTDVDSADFNGGYLLLEYFLGGTSDDQLNLPSLVIDGVVLGTLASDGSGGTELRVELNGNATPDRVEQLIETITYQNTSQAPEAERTIRITVNDGDGGTSEPRDILVKVAAMNDAPILTEVGEIIVFSEDAIRLAPAPIDSNVTVTSPDGEDLGGGSVLVAMDGTEQDQLSIRDEGTAPDQIGFDGTTVTYQGVDIGTVGGLDDGANGADLRIDLLATATVIGVEALIENLTYQNSSEDPGLSRTATITITDGGGLSSDPRSVNILIAAINDAPELEIADASASFTENDFDGGSPLPLGIDATLTDVDSADFEGGTLLIEGSGLAEDSLGFPDLMGLGTIVGADDGLMGSDLRILLNATATPDAVADLLDTLAYRNGSQDPTEFRTLEVTVTDGDGGSSVPQQIQVQVVPVNDAPELDNVVSTLAVDENDPATPVDMDVALTDVDSTDFAGGFLLVEYVVGGGSEDQLEIADLVVGGVTIGIVDGTLNGMDGQPLRIDLDAGATPDRVEMLIERLTYRNSSEDPTASRTIRITVNDGDGTAIGGMDTSAPRDVVITVEPENDDPTITGLGPEVSFLENVVNAAPQPVDMSVLVEDDDNSNFEGGTLTISGSGLPEDTLAFSSMLGIGDIDPNENGQAGAALKITFNANATPEQVSLLLESLTYANSSHTPTTTRDLTVTLTDGPGPGAGSTMVPLTIGVTPQNDVPEILDFVSEATFQEMGMPEVIDGAVQVIDPDMPPNLDSGFLMITYASGGTEDDQLNLPSLTVDGVPIGTFEMGSDGADGAPIKVHFNANATPERVAMLLETLTYHNTSEDPAYSRTIQIVVDDGTMAPEGTTSAPHLVELIVEPMNDPPVFSDVTSLVSFREDDVNAGLQPVGLNVGLSDVDSEDYDGGSLFISGSGLAEDTLAFSDLMGIGTIQPPNDGMAGRALEVRLNALATPDTVQALLGTLTYANDSDRPTFSRTLSITLTEEDGTASEPQPLELEIQVEPVNDNPELLSSTPSASFLENDVNAAPQSLALDVSVTDPDSDHFDGGFLLVSYSAGGGLADQLVLPSLMVDGVLIGTLDGAEDGLNGNPLRVHLNANATPVRVETLIETLSYRNTSNAPETSRTIDIVVDDGGAENSQSQTQSVEILIEPEPDAPDLEDVGILQVYNEQDVNAAPQFIDSNVTLTDDDSADLWGGNVFVEYINGTGGEEQDQLGVLDQGDGPDQIGVSGQTISFGGVPFATIDSTMTGEDGMGLRIFFGAGSTPEAVEALIEAFTYQNTSDTPTFSRTVRITVTDDTALVSDPRVVELQITPVNDAPVLTEIPATLDVVENDGPELVASDAGVMDADSSHFEGGNLMIVYTDGGSTDDQLVLPSLTVGGVTIGSYDMGNDGTNGTPIKVIFNANATPERVQLLLQTLTYENTSDDPEESRTISITVTDGPMGGPGDYGAVSVAHEVVIGVQPVNDAPVVDGIASPAVLGEQAVNMGPQDVLDAGVTVSDVDSADFSGGFIRIEYAAGEFGTDDNLSFPDLMGIGRLDPTDDGLQGRALQVNLGPGATPAAVEALLEKLQYENTSDTPASSRTVRITVNDGDGTANSGDDTSAPDRLQIVVTPQNDAPELSVLDTVVSFDENFVNEDFRPVFDAGVTVSDADSTDFDGGFIRIGYDQSDSGTADDNLRFPDLMGIGMVDSVDNGLGGNALKILLNSRATPAAVETLLETLQYQNTSDTPAATRTIEIAINDGDGTANGGDDTSSPDRVQIQITPQNDVPQILDFVFEATFEEMGTPTVIDDTVRVIDPDLPPNLDSGFLMITYTSGGTEDDQLNLPSLMVDGVPIGDFEMGSDGADGAPIKVIFNANATPERVARLLETLTYHNTSEDPAESRTIQIVVDDGTMAPEGSTSDPHLVELIVEPVNDPPVLSDVATPVSFSEDDVNMGAQRVGLDVGLTDVDSENYDGGSLLISGSRLAEDTLAFSDLMGIGTVQPPNDGMAGRALEVRLNALATPDTVQALLGTLTYANDSDRPTFSRTLSITLTEADGTASTPQPLEIQVEPVNDNPELLSSTPSASFLENDVNAAPQSLALDVSVTDPDSDHFDGGFLLVSYSAGGGLADQLVLPSLMVDGVLIGTLDGAEDGLNGNPLRVHLNANATPARVETLIETLSYRNTSNTPDPSRTIDIVVDDGGAENSQSQTQSVEILIEPEPDAPDLEDVGILQVYNEQDVNAAPQFIDSNVTLTDDDSADLWGGNVFVEYVNGTGGEEQDQLGVLHQGDGPDQIGVSGQMISFGGVVFATIDSTMTGEDGMGLRIFFGAGSTPEAVEALIEAFTYQNTSDTPTFSRTVRITVTDDTALVSDPRVVELQITPVNDAPVLAEIPATLDVVENDGPELVASDAGVMDADSSNFEGGNLMIVYTDGGSTDDQLVLPSLTVGGVTIGSYDMGNDGTNGTPIKVIFNANATPERVQQLLQTLTYENTSDDPEESRTISITITDDLGATSMVHEVAIGVQPVNDAPEVDGIISPVVLDEQDVNAGPRDVLGTGVVVSDVDSADFSGGFVRIEYAAGEFGTDDNLSFPDLMGIGRLDPTDDGLQGRALQINLGSAATPATVEALLETLQYQNTSDTPAESRTVRITVNDGDGTANGGDDTSAPDRVQIQVTSQNDAPELTGLQPAVSFRENLVNAEPRTIDMDLTVRDPDSADFDGGFIFVEYVAGTFGSDDNLSVPDLMGIGMLDPTDNGLGGNALKVHLGPGSTRAAVEALLETLQYQNTSDTPAENRTIRISINDGDGTANGGMDTSTPRDVVITVTPQNDAPTITDLGPEVAFLENDVNAAPQPVDMSVLVEDVDSANFEDGSLLISGSGLAEDTLAFPDLMGIGMIQPPNDGMNGAALEITFNANATPDQVSLLLESLAYANSSDTPTASRELTVTLTDGSGPGAGSTTVPLTIDVTAQNDAPQLSDLDSAVSFGENLVNAAPQPVDMDLTVRDPDSIDFASGSVTISYSAGGGAEDQLSFATLEIDGLVVGTIPPGLDGINGNPLRVDFTTNATPDRVERLLEGLQYQNTSDTPTANRTLSIVIDDGDGNGESDASEIIVVVNPENDAPVLDGITSPAVLGEEAVNGGFQPVLDAGVMVSDPDSADFDNGFILIENTGQPEDNFAFPDLMGIGVVAGMDDGMEGRDLRITLNDLAMPTTVQTLLGTLTYQNPSDDPAFSRTVQITVDDGDMGGDPRIAVPLEIQVEPHNDAPVLEGITSPTVLGEEAVNDGFRPVLDAGVVVSDPDSANFENGYILIDNTGQPEDNFAFPNLMGIGVIEGMNDGMEGRNLRITLNDLATPAAIEALLQTLQYRNPSDDPSFSRTVQITINDGDMDDDTSAPVPLEIQVEPFNDAPAIEDLDSPAPFLENTVNDTPQPVDMDVSVTDADSPNFAGGELLITYADAPLAEDQLAFIPGLLGIGAIVGGSDGTNGADLRISLNAAATPAQVEALLETLTYQNTSDTPTATRTIEVTLMEADGTTSVARQALITVMEENDAPDLSGAGGEIVFSEDDVNDTPQIIDSNVNVSDPDSANFDGGSVLVTYEVDGGSADESLSVREGPSGIGMVGFDESTGIVTVDGIEIGIRDGGQDGMDGRALRIDLNDQATPERVERLIERITYQNVSDDPAATRTVRIRVEDDHGGMSDPLDTTIRITPVNDAPVLTDVDSPLELAELPGTNVPATVIDPDVSLSDVDSSDFGGGFLNVAYSAGGATSDERLSILNVSMDPGEVGFDGTNVSVGGTVIGSVDGTLDGANGADLQINLNAEATPDRVELLVEHVTYANGSDDPAASRTVSITVNDGENPSSTSVPRDVVINVAPGNDAPSIPAGFEATVLYAEQASPVTLDASVDLVDPDSADFMDGEVLLSYQTPSSTADELGVSLSFDGFVIGSIDGTDNGQMGADLRIVLNADATLDRVERLLESLTYQNTSDDPTGAHTLELTVSDGDGGTSSPPTGIQISITPQNDLPMVDLDANDSTTTGSDFEGSFTEGPGMVAITETVEIDDPDGTTITSATVTLTNPMDVDEFENSLESLSGTSSTNVAVGPYSPATGVLELTGTASFSEYQTVLESIRYANSDQDPDTTPRVIEVVVVDDMGLPSDPPAISTIAVTGINDAPTIAPPSTVEYLEGSGPMGIAPPDLVISDVDSAIQSATVALGNVQNPGAEFVQLSGEGLRLAGLFGVSVVPTEGVALTLTSLTSSVMPEQYQQILAELQYRHDLPEADLSPSREVTVTVTDNEGVDSISADTTITIDILKNNDAPSIKLAGAATSSSATFAGIPVAINADDPNGVDVFDPDDQFMSMATVTIFDPVAGDVLALDPSVQSVADDNGIDVGFADNVLTLTSTGVVVGGAEGGTDVVYEMLLNNILFSTTAPGPSTRRIDVQVFDAFETPAESGVAMSLITVTAPGEATVNLAPSVDLDAAAALVGGSTSWEPGDLAVSITSGIVDVSDADGSTLDSATITLVARPDGPAESLDLTPAAIILAMANDVSVGEYDAESGTLLLSGTASHGIYESLLESVVYGNVAETPTAGPRAVQVVVNDGETDSRAATSVVNVTGVEPTTEVLQMAFDVEAWPHAYVENGVRVESLGDPGEDLYLNDHDLDGSGDLLQIAGGGPYEFSMEGQAFDLLSVDVALNFGTGTLTASNGASVTIPAGTGTLNLGEDFQGVTSVQWTVSSGLMLLDDMRFEGERPVTVTGTDEMDLLIGTDADETLDGAAGTDELRGGDGDDVLVGGEGDDLLLGGGGDDTLIFEPFSGNDTVGDFAAGAGSEDLLDLRGRGFTNASNVMENATQDGSDVVIDLGDGDSVRLVGTELSALHADDFLV